MERFLQILLDAMSQLFFSLSVSMGIMITYGSYVKPEVNLNKSVSQIEFFDTGVALLAGVMIIPAVFVFSGTDGMGVGPSLMFVSLPKVFDAMGPAGTVVGVLSSSPQFCDADLLHFGFGVYRCELYGNLPHGQKEDDVCAGADLPRGFRGDRARVQRVLLQRDAAERLECAASGHYGLRQQQRYDAVDRACFPPF